VSLSPQQRAQILYLHRVEGVSIVLIAAMTELSRAAVTKVVQLARQQDASADGKAARRPSSKGRIERPFPGIRELARMRGS
jgi:DNA-directed RNA polymerase specialized sigma24 family protein